MPDNSFDDDSNQNITAKFFRSISDRYLYTGPLIVTLFVVVLLAWMVYRQIFMLSTSSTEYFGSVYFCPEACFNFMSKKNKFDRVNNQDNDRV